MRRFGGSVSKTRWVRFDKLVGQSRKLSGAESEVCWDRFESFEGQIWMFVESDFLPEGRDWARGGPGRSSASFWGSEMDI